MHRIANNTNAIAKLVEQLKTKTEYEYKIDEAYNFYPDWP